jgi:hypothetical protein
MPDSPIRTVYGQGGRNAVRAIRWENSIDSATGQHIVQAFGGELKGTGPTQAAAYEAAQQQVPKFMMQQQAQGGGIRRVTNPEFLTK